MKLICALLMVMASSTCFAAITNLPSQQCQLLEDSSRFRPITKLPPSIVALCADGNGRLAQPGGKWEPTDVISDASLPWKRLIWAAKTENYYVVHYERGGRGHSYHILVATMENGEAKAIWRAVGDPFQNYAEFVKGLHTEALADDVRYAY
ncbi:MAG: hypothetical protein AB7D06_07955 [Pedobacter sp.]